MSLTSPSRQADSTPAPTSTPTDGSLASVETVVVSETAKVGGAETSLLEFLAQVPADERDRFAVVFPDEPGALRARVADLGFPSLAVPLPPNLLPVPDAGGFVRTVRALSRLVRSAPVSTVYGNQISTGPLLTALKLRHPGLRTVLHVRDHRGPAGALFRHVPLQDAVVFNSGFVREAAVGGRLGSLMRGSDAVVYNCVDVERARERAAEPATVPGDDGETVGLFGRFERWKGFDYAVRELCHPDVYPHVDRVLLVGADSGLGDPDYEAEVRDLLSRVDPAGKVHLLPFQDNVWPYYDACDVVCVPSYDEPFGRVAIEAGALGIPVLAANSGGLREIVRDGETGFLFDHDRPSSFRAGALDLLTDDALRGRLGEAAERDVCDRFSPGEYHAAVRSVLADSDAN